jgi:dihydrofolate reductase
LTEIGQDFAGDVLFPDVDPALWRESAREPHHGIESFDYAFVTYDRSK